MTNEPKTEAAELTAEQLEDAHGGLTAGTYSGALQNVGATNTLIGLLLPAVQKV